MIKKIKTIFLGTPQLASSVLEALINDSRFSIDLVITQRDKARGRNLELQASPVKTLALKNNIKIAQPIRIKESQELITEFRPDIIIVVAYGQIIPGEILNIPRYGCINIHGSLLPKYRGASCIQATILNGDQEGGISFIKMDEGMDSGPIIRQISLPLDPKENSQTLLKKLEKLSVDLVGDTVVDFIEGKIEAQAQDHTQTNYVKKIEKEDGHLNFSEKGEVLERKIRAYFPWPGAFAFIEKDDLPKKKILFKIVEIEDLLDKEDGLDEGKIIALPQGLGIICADKILLVKKIQLEGKPIMNSSDFLKGNFWVIGKILK